jgi:hypothetical protein
MSNFLLLMLFLQFNLDSKDNLSKKDMNLSKLQQKKDLI